MKRIYICGPMRGYPEHNVPAFNRAADRFRWAGWDVVNPVDLSAEITALKPNAEGGEYLRADIREILTCDAIAVLPGWPYSTGARAEVAVAITIGLTFYDAGHMAQMAAPVCVTIRGGYECEPGRVESLDAMLPEIRDWQAATFPAASPSSIAEHLRREAEELCRTPEDVEEMADIFLLLAGASRDVDLAAAVRAKLEKNRARIWGTPDAHGVVEHLQEGAA